MMDFFLPELVDVMIAERRAAAASIRISVEGGPSQEGRLRSRLAGTLGTLAAKLHPEAARVAIGLRRIPHDAICDSPQECDWKLCLCEE